MTKPETEKLPELPPPTFKECAIMPAVWDEAAVREAMRIALRAQGGGEALAYMHPLDISNLAEAQGSYVCRVYKDNEKIEGLSDLVPIYTTPAPAPDAVVRSAQALLAECMHADALGELSDEVKGQTMFTLAQALDAHARSAGGEGRE